MIFKKEQILFVVLGGFFVANAIIAEFIGVKIFSLEATLGIDPISIHLGGEEYSFNMTAGVLLWPVVFIMTDIINEYFGKRGVRILSFLAAGLIAYAFIMVFFAIGLEPAGWWEIRSLADGSTLNMNEAFSNVFGQGMWIIAGSLVAFLVGQLVDVYVFQLIRKATGGGKIWLRATGSTLVSQLIDSFVVLFIAFYLSGAMTLGQVVSIGIVNYLYKFFVAVALTPLLYLVHWLIDSYLGRERANLLIARASAEE